MLKANLFTVTGKNLIRGVLHYTHKASGAEADVGRGVVIGVVSTMYALGIDFDKAIEFLTDNLPTDFRLECIPSAWVTNQFMRDVIGAGIIPEYEAKDARD